MGSLVAAAFRTSRAESVFFETAFTEYQARISPDGRQVVYVSDESSTLEVYTAAFPTGDQKHRVSTGGGMHPSWRGDSRELFYSRRTRS